MIFFRFQQGCQQAQELYKYFGKNEENNFIVGASVAVRNLNYNYQQPAFFRHVSIYDFYHDMNINEVHRLTPVMKGLKKRVNELLLEWPEHPSLSKVIYYDQSKISCLPTLATKNHCVFF